MKTRDRILLCSLTLFNGRGEPNVTTLDVSTELDISPGNLYYHFKGKNEIIAELYEQFEAAMLELQVQSLESDSALLDMWTYLQFSFEIMAQYLYFYRDVSNLLGRYPLIRKRFNRLLGRQRKSLEVLSQALLLEGVLQAEQNDIASLVEHMTMAMTFWLNYQRVQAPDMEHFDPDLAQCAYQVMALLMPYLDVAAREELRLIADSYL